MHATATTRANVRAALACGVLAFAGFTACLAPAHLDPSPSSSGVGGSASSGSGCRSNPDCAYPTQVCDTVSRTCVGCLASTDCVYLPGSVCSQGQCVCPEGGCDAGSCPECGAGGGTGGERADGGHEDGGHEDAGDEDAGKKDAGVDAGTCVPTCARALMTGGTVCPADVGSLYYEQLQSCAECGDVIGECTLQCPQFCANEGAVGACETCLDEHCLSELMECEMH